MVTNQAYLFLVFTINGIIIGLLFDIFRILRRSFKTSDIVTYLQDILFWVLTGFILLYSIFTFSNGEIRFYMFLGVFLGCLIYMIIFSKAVIHINVSIIKFIIKEYSGVRMTVSYDVRDKKTGEKVIEAETKHCFTNKELRPVSLKKYAPEFEEKFKEYLEK